MTQAVEDGRRLVELLRGNEDIASHADGCGAGMIAAAEQDMGVGFPPSYRRLIEEFGTWDIAGQEFLGVYQTAAMGSSLLGSVAETLDARGQYGLPSELIVVMFDGMGGLIVLDSAESDGDGEYPVLVWDPGSAHRGSADRLGENFGSFALARCQRAVANWRSEG
ncbi:SMI1/KNR4 family protein [Kribbella sp. NBC_01505]|uniref:SMI1/KNR4 family protein n=1 Tax=Kribbella sp. NBC_01505 TaxID=2903580 RepID=UPI00386D3ABD